MVRCRALVGPASSRSHGPDRRPQGPSRPGCSSVDLRLGVSQLSSRIGLLAPLLYHGAAPSPPRCRRGTGAPAMAAAHQIDPRAGFSLSSRARYTFHIAVEGITMGGVLE